MQKYGWAAIGHVNSEILATALPWKDKAQVKSRIERITIERAVSAGLEADLILKAGHWHELEDKFRDYFEGKRINFKEKVCLSGFTEFEKSVLKRARKIPYGKKLSYGELADKIGSPKAARGVGSALGRNSAPLVIPCHRIIRKGGGLGGFSAMGGVSMKSIMLELEKNNSK